MRLAFEWLDVPVSRGQARDGMRRAGRDARKKVKRGRIATGPALVMSEHGKI
jgi:hypothetical protein